MGLTDRIASNERRIGTGYNALLGQWTNPCVLYNNAEDLETIGTAPSVAFALHHIEDYSSLRHILELDANLSLGFSAFSADVSTNVYSSTYLTRFRQYLLIAMSVENPPQVLKIPRLTEPAKRTAAEGYEAFVVSYGTKYIVGHLTGGRLYGLIEVTADTQKQLDEIKVDMNVAVGAWGEADARFKERVERFSKYSSLRISILSEGGTRTVPVTVHELFQKAKNFTTEVGGAYKVQYSLLSDFNGLEGYPSDFNSMLRQTRKLQVRDKLIKLGTYMEECRAFKNDLAFIRANPEQFSEDQFQFGDRGRGLESLTRGVDDQIEAYRNIHYKILGNYLLDSNKDNIEDGDLAFSIPPPVIPTIKRTFNERPKAEVLIRHLVFPQITTDDLHDVRCGGRRGPGERPRPQNGPCTPDRRFQLKTYNFNFRAGNPANILRNLKISAFGDQGSAGWNAPHLQAPKWNYIRDTGMSAIDGSFDAGSKPISVSVECDEYEIR